MKYTLVLFFVVQHFLLKAQSSNPVETSKKLYVAGGIIGGISTPYATSGNENGIAISGINSGLFIGAGMIQQLSKKMQLQHFVNLFNISSNFHYKLPVEDMSYTSLYGLSRTKSAGLFAANGVSYQLTAGVIVSCNESKVHLSTGVGVNYIFTQGANRERSNLVIRAEVGTGTYKNCIFTQRMNRLSFDVPFEVATDKVAGYNRLRIALRYNLAINSRSTGSFSFDKNVGVATGQYRFIGSTASMVLGWVIN